MKRYLQLMHYVVLVAVTLAAGGVMWWAASRNDGTRYRKETVTPLPETIAPKPRVVVLEVTPREWPVYRVFSGKIQPWETYRVGFEIGGRIVSLNDGKEKRELDVGDRVRAQQVIGVLDDQILRARRDEASAQLELAKTEMTRARKLRDGGSRAITDTEYQRRLTDEATASARYAVAQKSLEDTILRAPVDATIARRHFHVGESVSPHAAVFDLVEDDTMLLVVDVPESHIRELQRRMDAVHGSGGAGDARSSRAPDERYRAIVRLQGVDQFGKPWPPVAGTVHEIAQLALPQTGMFEVEIETPNTDRLLRSGMVATAWIETDRIFGYRVPETALISRRGVSHLFTVSEEKADVRAVYWRVGETKLHRARRIPIDRFVEQRRLPRKSQAIADGDDSAAVIEPQIIIPADADAPLAVVVRGQYRLTDKQPVRVVASDLPVLGSEEREVIQNQGADDQSLGAARPSPHASKSRL